MTKTHKNGQNEKPSLTNRQIKAIPLLVSSPTYSEGCKRARISRNTLYEWLRDTDFKAEMDHQRDEIARDGLAILTQGVTRAAETLVALLDDEGADQRVKRMAAGDVIRFFVQHKELKELEDRFAAVEEKLGGR